MLALLLALLTPAKPVCQVQVAIRSAPWAETPGGMPWRYLDVQTTPDCPKGGEARVRLTNYGGRYPGAPVVISQGTTITFGPVPINRGLEWLSPSGIAYNYFLPGAP